MSCFIRKIKRVNVECCFFGMNCVKCFFPLQFSDPSLLLEKASGIKRSVQADELPVHH